MATHLHMVAWLLAGPAAVIAAHPAVAHPEMPRAHAAVFSCTATSACLPDGDCASVSYRAAMLSLVEFDPDAAPGRETHLMLGPLAEGAGGGLFYRSEQIPVIYAPDGAPEDMAAGLETDAPAFWVFDTADNSATHFRPAREVPGLTGAERAFIPFTCEQVLF